MTGGAGGEEEHGIFFANGVGVVDLGEELRRVAELAFELVADLLAGGEAAGADGGTDGGDEVFRAGAELATEGTDAALDDAGEGAAPAGMEGGHSASPGVGDEDRDAVGGEDAEEKVGIGGEEGVAAEDGFAVGGGKREGGGIDTADDPGMALADGDEVGDVGGIAGFRDGGDEAAAGFEDRGGVVLGGVAEVLLGRASGGVGGGLAALAGAETSEEPGVGLPIGDGDYARASGSGGGRAAASAEACGGRDGGRLGWLPGWVVWRTAHRQILQR